MSAVPHYTPEQAQDKDKRPWVLLRGLAREQRHWGEFPRQMAEQLGATVLCPDTPGNGYRCQEASPLSIRDTLERVRTELGTTGPVNLLGLSMGGMIATEWAQHYPQEINALVLVNTSFANFSPPWHRLWPSALVRVLGSLAKAPTQREARIFDLICQRKDDRDKRIGEWASYALERPLTRANFGRQLAAAARYRAPLQPPVTRLLVLNGSGDQLVNPACSHRIAERWGARIEIHPWAGHDLTHDDPQWVLERIVSPP